MKTKASRAKTAKADTGPEMKGAEAVVECLIREGVDVIFAYPGGASLELHQALAKTERIRTILPRHEQGGAFAAGGYARATGKVGVCMATSGPGATNLVSGIADAYMDSIPLVAITGQVYSKFIGKMAFQETDFFGMTLPVVKHSYLVMDVRDLPRIFREAFQLARSGRPGPVVIDLPKDVQQTKFTPVFPAATNFRSPYVSIEHRASDAQLEEVIALVAEAKKPMIYAGGGILSSEAHRELKAFAEAANIPVATTLMGVGGFPESHPLSMRWFGMHGSAYGNWAVDECDLLIGLGVRFDDRITGDTHKFAARAKIVHVDIDASEHHKNKRVNFPILSDVRYALGRLNELLAARKFKPPVTKPWHDQLDAWKRDYPFRFDDSRYIQPQEAVKQLYELTKGDAIIVTGVGQHQMWSAQFYQFDAPRRFISSLGLGAMGFGFPAALGAKVGRPDKPVIDIDGDGSFLMNIQELATAHIEKIAAKAIILNNQHLGMVVQWEDNFYGGNRGHTYLGDPEHRPEIYPDYVRVCNSFGVKCERVMFKKDLRAAMQRMLDADEPYVLDVVVPYSTHVIPFIPAGKTVADMIWKP